MILSVKTTGLLGRFLPPGSARNRGDVELAQDSTLLTLLEQLGVDEPCLISVNDQLIQPEEFAGTQLTETDKVILMAPLTAG